MRISISEISLRLNEMRDKLDDIEITPNRNFISQSLFHLKNYYLIDELGPSLYQITELGKNYLDSALEVLNFGRISSNSERIRPREEVIAIYDGRPNFNDIKEEEENEDLKERAEELDAIWKWKSTKKLRKSCIETAIELASKPEKAKEEAVFTIFADLFGGIEHIPIKFKEKFDRCVSESLDILRR